MREIKFRVWDGKQMLDNFLINAQGDILDPYDSTFQELINRDKWVLMQYTGLKDKNGKEIYEGDIIYFPAYTRKGYVFWDNKYLSHRIKIRNPPPLKTQELNLIESKFSIGWNVNPRIIGNIYENPELLEKK